MQAIEDALGSFPAEEILLVTHPEKEASRVGGVKYGIALAAALISLAHVVGLLLMASVRYRGPLERFFAGLVIWGMPPAIVASLLISWLA